MTIKTEFDFEEKVFLKTDVDQKVRLITTIEVRPNDLILYELACGIEKSWHYRFEISRDKDVMLTSTN